MFKLYTITIHCLCILLVKSSKTYTAPYNLIGDAGQAYAIQVEIGHPPQFMSLIVDTGSTTLAVAGYNSSFVNKYFHPENSTTVLNSGKEVHAKYSTSNWVGHLAYDFIKFPSLPNISEVRADIAFITKSQEFFGNGTKWQGLLGLAYLPIGAWGDNIIVESWLDSLDRLTNKPASFQLKLCGPLDVTNATHFGNMTLLDDDTTINNINPMFRTPILRKCWYEVGVLSIRVLKINNTNSLRLTQDDTSKLDEDVCRVLNEEKSIVDSGTTNIKIPDKVFRIVVADLKRAAEISNTLISDNFWYNSEVGCWPEPQEWNLPWIGIDLLQDDDDNQYFTLGISPQNYMRVVSAKNNTSKDGISEYCYKLGLTPGKDTVLGYTAMEGFEILFNRSSGWIGWQTSDCGPKTFIWGPYNITQKFIKACELQKTVIDLTVCQWALGVLSIIASTVVIYLLAPCVKNLLMKPLQRSSQISLSQAALVEHTT